MFFAVSYAQSTDIPKNISYQGQVTTSDGKTIGGNHQFTVTFYSDPHSKKSIWQGKYQADIVKGIFNILLGSGKFPLPSTLVMNQPLWVGVRVDEGDEMQPLAQLAGVPYAMNVPNKSITAEKLSDDLSQSILNAGHSQSIQSTTSFKDITSDTNTSATMVVGSGASLIPCSGVIRANDYSGTLNVTNGGTGNTSFTSNGVLLGNSSSALSVTSAGSANQVLRVGSGGGAPSFGAINLSSSSAVTGVLPIANGGNGPNVPWYIEGNDIAAADAALGTGYHYQPIIGTLNGFYNWLQLDIQGHQAELYTYATNTNNGGQQSLNIVAFPGTTTTGNVIAGIGTGTVFGGIIAGGGGCRSQGTCGPNMELF
jgi:hypothetical protein